MYEQHHAELYRSAVRACRDPGTAEDLVQEAFLRLMIEIGGNRTPDNIRAWLHRVIANLAVSLGRRATVSQRFAGALWSHDQPATPEAIALDDELRADLASALQALPDRARTALLLAASGYSGAEIAAAIGRTDCATRTLMCRARLELRDRLGAGATRSREAVEAVGSPYAVSLKGSAGPAQVLSATAQ
jgi:RNA polymerase sigma factor (sigma-70 family)